MQVNDILNQKQKEIVTIAQEECAELIVSVSKCLRFGLDITNVEKLTQEAGDVLCMLELMMANGVIDSMQVLDAKKRKYEKLKTWSNIFSD
jgi:NTP pyrophosphatase (non-canonical NTP hydrolase)